MWSPLISVADAAQILQTSQVVVLDVSFTYPAILPKPPAGFIPGALYWDIEHTVVDTSSPLPHMMPGVDLVQASLQDLGVSGDSHILLYDNQGVFASPRAWWMLRSVGLEQVQIINGGLPAWLAAGFSAMDTPGLVKKQGDFVAKPRKDFFIDADRVEVWRHQGDVQLLDARSAGRFHGIADEPRPGLRSGHIPGAKSLPYSDLLRDGLMKPPEELALLFSQRGVNSQQTLVFFCGSGVSACVLALGATLAGYKKLHVYDGSWAEWGASERPLAL